MELDIPEGGEGEGRTVLTMLARHPATARHIATKLARHFIADDPPPVAVERLARAFLDHDGDLKIMSAALVESPEAWAEPLPNQDAGGADPCYVARERHANARAKARARLFPDA